MQTLWSSFLGKPPSEKAIWGTSWCEIGCRELTEKFNEFEPKSLLFSPTASWASGCSRSAYVHNTGDGTPSVASTYAAQLVYRVMTFSDLALLSVLPMQSSHNRERATSIAPTEDRVVIQLMIPESQISFVFLCLPFRLTIHIDSLDPQIPLPAQSWDRVDDTPPESFCRTRQTSS